MKNRLLKLIEVLSWQSWCRPVVSHHQPSTDILIQNGTIVDGSGAPAYSADIAIVDDEIVKIGKLSATDAARVIDATGLVVSPGFYRSS